MTQAYAHMAMPIAQPHDMDAPYPGKRGPTNKNVHIMTVSTSETASGADVIKTINLSNSGGLPWNSIFHEWTPFFPFHMTLPESNRPNWRSRIGPELPRTKKRQNGPFGAINGKKGIDGTRISFVLPFGNFRIDS